MNCARRGLWGCRQVTGGTTRQLADTGILGQALAKDYAYDETSSRLGGPGSTDLRILGVPLLYPATEGN
jgi:hypothetical protein